MSYQCELVVLEEQKALSVRTRISVQKLPDLIGTTYMEIIEYLQSIGESQTIIPFVGYFNMDMDDLDVEIGIPVTNDVPDNENMTMSKIPSGSYAQTIHTGPYSKTKEAYTAMMQWMEEHGQEGTGKSYEFYLNNPKTTPEEDLQTKILFQLL